MIKTYDLRKVRGTTIRLKLTVKDEAGQKVDLTGATVHLRVRTDLKAAALISKSSPSTGITISNQTTNKGECVATLAPGDTAALQPGDYVWDSWVVEADGDRFAVIAPSKLTLIQEVTTLP